MLNRLFISVLFIVLCIKTYRKPEVKKQQQPREKEQQNFHEVDAFGDDFVDFGAQTGPKGQFSWHADFPLE
ncbi:unnamed protein product [Diamesa hyperborea]